MNEIYQFLLILLSYSIFTGTLIITGSRFLKNKREISGKSPINPLLFKTGKISSFGCQAFVFLEFLGVKIRIVHLNDFLVLTSLIMILIGSIISAFAFINLGYANKFGLPTETTTIHKNGLYNISRNPMYLGFYLMMIGAMMFTFNFLPIVLGMYAIFIHHRIVLAEERFLQQRFGDEYQKYMSQVRRYL